MSKEDRTRPATLIRAATLPARRSLTKNKVSPTRKTFSLSLPQKPGLKLFLPDLFAPALLLGLAVIPALVFPAKAGRFISVFFGLTLEVMPFILLGAIFAALMANWHKITRRLVQKFAGNKVGAALTGLGLGFILPVCECGAASVARQATRGGAPVMLSVVFLLAAPILNPITILVTWLAFGADWLIMLGRIALGLIIALSLGFFFNLHPRPTDLLNSSITEDEHEHTGSGRLPAFLDSTISEFQDAFRTVLPGLALAAACQAYIPGKLFTDIGQGALFSVVVMMLLAFLMSACSTVDAFIVLGFTGLFPAGAILAFLVFGPLINLKSLLLMRLVLSRKAIGLISLFTFLIVLLAAVLVNLRWV